MTTRVLMFNGTDSASQPQPYGAEALTNLGYELATAPRARLLPPSVTEKLYHRYGIQVGRPGLRAARRSHLVLAYLEPNIGYPAAMKRIPLSPYRQTPLVSIVCWAAEDLLSGSSLRRARVLRMLNASDVVAYFSENQRQTYLDHDVDPDKLVVLPFGVDVSRAVGVEETRDLPLLSVGWDRGRDYATLADAVRGTDLRIEVVANADNLAGIELPVGLVPRGTVSADEYHRLLLRAQVVVVPTRALAYPTGQTVALEAAVAGCAVVVTDTPAMRDYFTPGETALMPPPHDSEALRDALYSLRDDPTQRRRLAAAGSAHVRRHHSQSRIWSELDLALRERAIVRPDR